MISIILLTFNAEKYLDKFFVSLFENLDKCSEESEILLIDSSSNDKTVEIARKYNVRPHIIERDEFDHGGTRTLAARISRGDILIYFTQDALLFNEDSISNLIKHFKDQDVGAVYGRQVYYDNINLFGKHLRLFNYPENFLIKTYEDKYKYGLKTAFLSNSFCAYRKTALEEIGYFKEKLIMGEDSYAGAMLLKSGYKLFYEPNATVFHSHSYSVFQEFKRYFDIGVFHRSEHWLLEEFGKAEGEGLKYIKSELGFLIKNRSYNLIPEYIVRNILKYLGYRLGLNYNILPKSVIKKLSMHRRWWK